ncbi:uncharacterized protein J7T54_003708 [Emericellopsis cladophorae]|uniref:Transcription factor domain-containing protein n=1 Tax=Emericellopsis cladophorae TaxID=2686198 RepID=A0A9P9XXN7_9HYPO|nr:uncharacterized protein J7T54_003708 [Emericellopsis cladophorae]KAI6779786.1 hypothetical protein J7T54_003708 [Emericellopsis cladophorae]
MQEDNDGPPITIPLGHQTSTSNLLMMPQCRALLGEYPEEFFFKVEMNRPRAWAVRTMMVSDLDNLADTVKVRWVDGTQFLESYLKRVHPFHPFLDRDEVREIYEDTMHKGIGIDNSSALVLTILALGATVSDAVDLKPELRTGEAFIQQALKILFASWTFNFSGDVIVSQALSLCSLDILAEFHQPRNGIELLVDRMPFPNYGELPSPENLYALADISARALLNRIHHALFFTESLIIYSGHSLNNRNIFRAFVIYVTSKMWEGEEIPKTVLDMCEICLHGCRMFIIMAQHLIRERSPYTYSATQCCLSSSIMAIAAQSPPLKGMIADIESIHVITLELLEPWAQAGTSIKTGYQIASLIAAKQLFK